MKLVSKLLRSQISRGQMAGFFLANLVGMLIVSVSVQLWFDVHSFFKGEDPFLKENFLVVTKKVGTLGILSGRSGTFTKRELEEIKRQPFVEEMGYFMPSRFQVTAGIELEKLGSGFSTELFFESVPDKYLDVKPSHWSFTPGEKRIPILLPRHYLNLYNFGFAQSRNLPKLSENIVEMLELDVEIGGNGRQEHFIGKVAGFSDRLNTILVPEQFMTWANRIFAGEAELPVSRLILKTTNPAGKEMTRFLSSKGYEVENDKLESGKFIWLLNILTIVIAGIGLLICILAFYILILSIYLLVQKNTAKIENLVLLGYSGRAISRPYETLACGMNGMVMLLAWGLLNIIRYFYFPLLKELNPRLYTSGIWPTLVLGVILWGIICSLNIGMIRRKLGKIGWERK